MEHFFTSHGYLALFLLSFLAATVLPLGSEWLLGAMLFEGFSPLPVVATATVGNYLGACTTYLIGIYGAPFLIEKILRIEESSQRKAEYYFRRYGSWTLLFSWLPIIGDPLCLVGGLLRVPFSRFSTLVIIGKLTRYAGIALLLLATLRVSGE
jgi:membrane protein YqaA with SNARE-associated domain